MSDVILFFGDMKVCATEQILTATAERRRGLFTSLTAYTLSINPLDGGGSLCHKKRLTGHGVEGCKVWHEWFSS